MSLNSFLTPQFSGPYAQGVVNAILNEYVTLNTPILDYYTALSIATADFTIDSDGNPIFGQYNDLQSIGYLVGYPWPTAPTGAFDSNALVLSNAASYPTASPIGLSAADGSRTGGILISTGGSGTLIPASIYRILLANIAYLKYNGLSWTSIDKVVSGFCPDPEDCTGAYEYQVGLLDFFTFGAAASFPQVDHDHGWANITKTFGGAMGFNLAGETSDIFVKWITPITAANLYILQQVFQFVCTTPQVTVSN